jgi:hypothetical protein
MTPAETDVLLAEIRAWLTVSRVFYRSYGVTDHLGPHYFVINSIVANTVDSDQLVFRELLKGLPPETKEGSSMNHDLSACLEHLRQLRYLDLFEGKTKSALAGRPQFPVSTLIKVREKLHKATKRYARHVLRELFGREFEEKYSPYFIKTSALLFEFAKGPFVREWGELLKALSKKSPISGTARGAFLNEMTGSTEYYILLMSLWEMKLVEDDEEGYRLSMLHSLHGFTRYVKQDDLHQCVKQLVKHGIIKPVYHEDEEEHYRLADEHIKTFLMFGEHLKEFRDLARAEIEKGIESH